MNIDPENSAAQSTSEDDPVAAFLADANSPEKSPFDYVIVGSGAGGGPLAARLAEQGKRVLVIEAGPDPVEIKYPNKGRFAPEEGEVTRIPGYYGAASEDAEMSWMFSVRHYADTTRQALDEKYNKYVDPNTGGAVPDKYKDPHPGGGRQGVFYPRSSGIGGCTAHHAMITICPNDSDWNDIAVLTGDPSWSAGAMRGYFAKFERNQYLKAYDSALNKFFGLFYKLYRRIILLLDPRAVLDEGGHGFKGWAPTNLLDPFLIATIAKTDHALLRAIVRAALGVLHGNWSLIKWLKSQGVKLRIVNAIDFNDINTRRVNPEGIFLIPLGIEGDEKQSGKGSRFGVREFLFNTRSKHPDRLVIKSGLHVTRVLFERGKNGDAPRAIGVECAAGDHLYEASPVQDDAPPSERRCYFAKKGGEIILCGGAFNTPQLLMLSGIGDKEHLAENGIHHLYGATEATSADGRVVHKAAPLSDVPVIHLPGVGRNLQDRYEVTVVSELDKDLETLNDTSFEPGDKNDRARSQWLKDRTGLYGTNGGTLAIIRRSKPVVEAGGTDPDLFTFGAPAAFRGYYWNWSHEVFKETLGASKTKHNLWSWVILKAYTRNHDGSVRLRTNNPFDMPEICFDSFNEKAESERAGLQAELERTTAACDALKRAGKAIPKSLQEERRRAKAAWDENEGRLLDSKRDLAALVDAVSFMRRVNAGNPKQFVREIQPGSDIPDNSAKMEEWIRTQAWGHHCSCTCRIGSDRWKSHTSQLTDKDAVLDSRFRVHGVRNLRIVDASVFPKIPGYFILAPIFMISEKAADTLIQDSISEVYPAEFEESEAVAIRQRRQKAQLPEDPAEEAGGTDSGRLPGRTVGLALSGGGIRSATFALGILQALATRDRLRHVDILSTVSGGGFIGSFLGRLFTRETVKQAGDPCERVQETLKNTSSAPIEWLRTQANYIFATGSEDLRLNVAVLWRNIIAIYLVVGALLFTVFGLLAWLPDGAGLLLDRLSAFQLHNLVEPYFKPPVVVGIALSPWWWLPVLALGLGVIPSTLGYWLAPKEGSYRPYPLFPLLAWLLLLTGSLIALQIPNGMLYAGAVALVLVLAWLWQEVARLGAIRGSDTEAARERIGLVVRNRVVRSIGEMLYIFVGLVGWVILDTFAVLFAEKGFASGLTVVAAALAPLLPFLHKLATVAKQQVSKKAGRGFSLKNIAAFLGIPLAVFLVFVVDVHAHKAFLLCPGWALFFVALTGGFSFLIGRAFDFLNLSSLQATYAARIIRTFQGASNEERVYASSSSAGHDVGVANPRDDIAWHEYHPEHQGGPLHFVNVCVNETVQAASERMIRERKGLPMCITPHGVSVGRRYFARWSKPDSLPLWQRYRRWLAGIDGDDAQQFLPRFFGKRPDPVASPPQTALKALPVANDPHAFHVLATKNSESAEVESLTLGQWTGVSGAAFSTGTGRDTGLSDSLFAGLVNVRLGYWWDSGIRSWEHFGRYPAPLWRRLKRLPVNLFYTQSMLLGEWWGRFHGPSRRFWNLSDGGHFEVTGLYEMLRRRVRFMIVSDAGEDPKYQWGDISLLIQQAREDFGAEIVWLDFKAARAQVDEEERKSAENSTPEQDTSDEKGTEEDQRRARWKSILQAYIGDPEWVEEWIQDWMNPDALGTLNDIKRKGDYHAALARVTYDGSSDVSWILLLKPSLSKKLTQDIINYGIIKKSFPQQPTFDQVFDDIQWESYRALGQQIGHQVLR